MHYQDSARKFARKSLLPFFGGEFCDGNSSLLPETLKTAFEIGIAANDVSLSGCHYGIWGGAPGREEAAMCVYILEAPAK
jgi:hypothetical protein